MEVTIYTDSLSVDKTHSQVRVTLYVDVDDLLDQLDAVRKADYTDIRQEYDNLVDKHYELQEAYDDLRSKFDMLDP